MQSSLPPLTAVAYLDVYLNLQTCSDVSLLAARDGGVGVPDICQDGEASYSSNVFDRKARRKGSYGRGVLGHLKA